MRLERHKDQMGLARSESLATSEFVSKTCGSSVTRIRGAWPDQKFLRVVINFATSEGPCWIIVAKVEQSNGGQNQHRQFESEGRWAT